MTPKTKTRRNLGWLAVAFGMLIAVQMSFNIWKVYRSGGRIGQAQAELNADTKRQQELQKNLAYVQTSEFIEKEAREKLGMGKPGEVVVILPKFDTQPITVTTSNLPNWRKWWNLYVGI